MKLLKEITPEMLAATPCRLRCLTEDCGLARWPQRAHDADSLNAAGELHVFSTGHHVVIEGPEDTP